MLLQFLLLFSMTVLCSNCLSNQESMGMWMIHLANCHPLPVEWLSDKAKLLTDEENRRPYTIVTDSRKRRRRPTTPRPLNTFMIFSRHIRRNILSVFPDASNSLVSKELGLLWKRIAHDIKVCYEEEAKRLSQLHAQEFPNYKYQPKKRCRRYERVPFERQVSPTNASHVSAGTDEENVRERDNRSSSDIENQYIRYSILGKNVVKECQSFNSPLKSLQVKTEEVVYQDVPRPFNARLTNFAPSSLFLKQPRLGSVTNVYVVPSESLVSSSSVITQVFGGCFSKAAEVDDERADHNVEEEIDITSNIFGNELDLEWSEYDEDIRQDLPNLNSLFSHGL